MTLPDSSDKHDSEDQRLWERLRLDDGKALETLFIHYHQALYDYCLRLARHEESAKDCIQEVFVHIWRKRTSIPSVSSVRAYLITCVRRRYLSMLEQNRKRKTIPQGFVTDEDPYAFSPEDLVILQEYQDEKKELIQNALGEIPTRMREALYLRTFDDLSYKEIAEIMQVSPQVAYNYVSKAFRKLRAIIPGQR